MEALVTQFEVLSDDEKIAFFKAIFPSAFKTFKDNPQQLMMEVIPVVMAEIKSAGLDMGQLIAMASMMKSN